jgi:thiamine biosynthesis protein ThiS
MIHCIINGVAHTVTATTLLHLVSELNLPLDGIAIACNGAVVSKSSWQTTPLCENDQIEIVTPRVGG